MSSPLNGVNSGLVMIAKSLPRWSTRARPATPAPVPISSSTMT